MIRGLVARTLALLGVVFGARWAIVGGLAVGLRALHMHYGPDDGHWAFEVATLVGGLLVATWAWLGVRFLDDPAVKGGWTGPAALAVLAVLGFGGWQWSSHRDVFRSDYASDRAPGRFPFEAGETRHIERGGRSGDATIGPEGFRVCGPDAPGPDGSPVVTLLGDSMVFGLALDDHETLCAELAERMDDVDGLGWRNAGQPGAGIHSYVDTAGYVLDTFGTDVLVVGMLVPNDAQVYDVNHHRTLAHHPVFQVVGSLLDPHLVMSAVISFGKAGRNPLFDLASMEEGLADLAGVTATHDLPTVWFFYDTASRRHAEQGALDPYVAAARAHAEADPRLTWAGVFSSPPGVEGWWIADGHPDAAGNRALAGFLEPHVRAALPGAGGSP